MPIEKKIHQAQKSGQLPKGVGKTVLQQAIDKRIISKKEHSLIEEAEKARRLAIMVDDFVTKRHTDG